MQTKLTLRLDAELIAHAKQQAQHADKSLSQMVADYFVQLGQPTERKPLPPTVASLRGALVRGQVGALPERRDRQDYRDWLESKHQ